MKHPTVGLHSAALDEFAQSTFEGMLKSVALSAQSDCKRLWESKTAINDSGMAHAAQKKCLTKGDLKMCTETSVHFVASIQPAFIATHSAMATASEEGSLELVKLMTEHKWTADKCESTDESEQRKKCWQCPDSMLHWNDKENRKRKADSFNKKAEKFRKDNLKEKNGKATRKQTFLIINTANMVAQSVTRLWKKTVGVTQQT